MKPIKSSFVEGIAANLAFWQAQITQKEAAAKQALFTDHTNILQAVQYGLVPPSTCAQAGELILGAFHLVEAWGFWREWDAMLTNLVEAEVFGLSKLQISILIRLGHLKRRLRQPEAAVAHHLKASEMATQLEDPFLTADAASHLCEDYTLLRQFEMGRAYGEQALEYFETAEGHESHKATVQNALGLIELRTGDYQRAERYFQQAVSSWRAIERPIQLARTLNNLAYAQQGLNHLDEALASLHKAHDLLATTESQNEKMRILNGIGIINFKRSHLNVAARTFEEAAETARRKKVDMEIQASLVQNLGNVLVEQQKFRQAIPHLRRVIEMWQEIDNPLELANSLATLGRALVGMEEHKEALVYLHQAKKLASQYPQNAFANETLAEIEETLNE